MKYKFTIYLLSIALMFVLVMFLITLNNYSKDYSELSNKLLTSDKLHIEALNELSISYNELEAKYDEVYQKYTKLYNSLGEFKPFLVTGYSANDPQQGTTNLVKAGFNLDQEQVKNLPIVAVDPNIIPLYSIVEIKDLGAFVALDTGLDIKGNRIDILFDDKSEAIQFGNKICDVRIVKGGENVEGN